MIKTYSIRQILFLIVFSLLIPACLIAVGFSAKAYYDGRDKVTETTLQTAHAMTLVVERELVGLKSAAEALAFSHFLQTGDLAAFQAQATQVLRTTSGFAVVLSDSKGQQVVNTLKPYGVALPHGGNESLVTRVFATGKPAISDMYLGGVTKKPVVSISVPVVKDSKVVYALDIGLWPDEFSKLLLAQNIPNDWIVTIFDGSGTIVGRNKAADQFIGKKGAPDLLREMAVKPEGITKITTLEGIHALSMFSRSAITGWSVAISVPTTAVDASLWQSLCLSIGGALVLIVIGISIARYAGGRLADSIRMLALKAAALGRGEALVTPALALKEAADFLTELAKTNDVLIQSLHEKKLAEQALQESEQRYAAIFAKTPLSTSLIKLPEGTIVSVNDAFVRLFDYSEEEAIGKTSYELGLIDATTRIYIETALRQNRALRNFECTGRTKNGAIVELSINVDRVSISGQTFMLTTIQDVTEIHGEQRERARLAAIVDFAKDAIISTTLEGVVTSWNQSAELLFGYTSTEAIGKTVSALVIPTGEEAEDADTLAKILRGDNVSNLITRRRRKNGTLIDVSIAASPIRNIQGALVGSARTVRDITTEVEINKRLQESERLLSLALDARTVERDSLEQRVVERTHELASTLEFNKAIIRNSPLPVGVYNSAGQCVLVNEPYAKLAGTTREILLGEHIAHTAAMKKVGLLDDELFAGDFGTAKQRELHVVSTFGKEVWVEFSIVPVLLNNEKHLLMQCFDLTERKQAEENLRVIATAFESQQAMMITDADKLILRVNHAFINSTGYGSDEVVGTAPSVFRSRRHDEDFYTSIWECIDRNDSWHGEIWDQRKNGEFFPNWVTITAVKNIGGMIANYVVTQIDC